MSSFQQDRRMRTEWQSEYDANRKGAGYFLSQNGRLRFEPSGYIAFRALEEDRASRLIQEWDRWIRDLKNSKYSFVREAAAATRPLTIHDLDQYFRDRIVVQRDKTILENSSKQLTDGDQEIYLRLQELRQSRGSPTSTAPQSIPVSSMPSAGQDHANIPKNMHAGSQVSTYDRTTLPPHPKSSSTQQKRKAPIYPLDLKPAAYPPPDSPFGSSVHAAFDNFRERSKAIASAGSIDFATHKAEALALNGIWFVGKAPSECSHAKRIHQAMRKDYRVPEYPDIIALTPKVEEILQLETEQDIAEAIDEMSATDIPWTVRRALKVWRQLLDTLPNEPRRDLQDGEQTFVNRVLQPFLSVTFSARGSKVLKGDIEHDSASEDKGDHKNGVRSDFFVVLPIPSLDLSLVGLIGEVKPPEKTQSAQLELKDQWKLFRMMKSEIDSQIKKGTPDPVVWGCQIFGYDVAFYVMDQRISLINCLMKVFTGTLPKSIEDVSGVGRIISAFFYIEGYITKRGQALE
ncbi:hypothetical protein BGZ94_004400, partial [Podila epigama]